jgi:polysaccharide pyruvyl transferase WcaK-like protein
MMPKQVVFFGLFGQGNFGNDCTLQAILYHARQRLPEARLKCVCTGPDDVRDRYKLSTFSMYAIKDDQLRRRAIGQLGIAVRWAKQLWREIGHAFSAYRYLESADLLVVAGTGLLVDHTTGFRSFHLYLFEWALLARLRGCKVRIVSVGAGPINHPLSRFLIRCTLGMADYRSYRDTYSKSYIEGIGFNTSADSVYPDLAFSLPKSGFPQKDRRIHRRPSVVGIGLLDYQGQGSVQKRSCGEFYSEYVEKISRVVGELLKMGYRVRLLIGDSRYDPSVRKDVMELVAVQTLRRAAANLASDSADSVDDLLMQLAQTDIVVSGRFHHIILAMLLNKKVVSLSYNSKFEYLMADMELSEYCQPLETLNATSLLERIAMLEVKQGATIEGIAKKLVKYRALLDEQFARVLWGRRLVL